MILKNKNIYVVFLNAVFLLAITIFAVNCESLMFVNQAPEISQDCYVLQDNKLVINIDAVEALQKTGGSAIVVDSKLDKKILIACTGNNTFRVVSSHCTHREKAIRYNHASGIFECSSLGRAKYDLNGKAKSGLAEGDLLVYNFTINQNKMTVSLF